MELYGIWHQEIVSSTNEGGDPTSQPSRISAGRNIEVQAISSTRIYRN